MFQYRQTTLQFLFRITISVLQDDPGTVLQNIIGFLKKPRCIYLYLITEPYELIHL